MIESKVKDLLDKGLEERPDLFLIDFSISTDNKIKVTIDGDKGVLVEDCIFISRAIEHHLDREEEDFSLEVMSAGATAPLVQKRQYKKHIGRSLKVRTATETTKGTLVKADDNGIQLEWKVREPKPVGKGKITVKKQADFAYDHIVEAKVMIKF